MADTTSESTSASASPDVDTPEQPTKVTEPATEVQPAVTGYRANTSGIGRLPVPLRDMPQTVNVVPQQVIQEIVLLASSDWGG